MLYVRPSIMAINRPDFFQVSRDLDNSLLIVNQGQVHRQNY